MRDYVKEIFRGTTIIRKLQGVKSFRMVAVVVMRIGFLSWMSAKRPALQVSNIVWLIFVNSLINRTNCFWVVGYR